MIAAIGIMLAIALLELIPPVIRDMRNQIDRHQAFVREWNVNCLRNGGKIIYVHKSNPSYICFTADGRFAGGRS